MPFASPIHVESERLLVRPVDAADIADLLETNGDDDVTHFLPYASWRSAEDGLAWFERVRKVEAAGGAAQLVVVDKAAGSVIGSCLLFRHEQASARAELGYVLGRRHWGRGYMHEALSALISHAFSSLGLRRLEAEVNPANLASCRLLERLRFTGEGLLRQRWCAKGHIYDTRFFGLLHDDWPARAGAEGGR